MPFCTGVKWKRLFLLFWATIPVCAAAQARRPADELDVTYYWQRPFAEAIDENPPAPSPASDTDPSGKSGEGQVLSPDIGAASRTSPRPLPLEAGLRAVRP